MKVVSFERQLAWLCDVKMRPVLSAMVWTLQINFLPLPPKSKLEKILILSLWMFSESLDSFSYNQSSIDNDYPYDDQI